MSTSGGSGTQEIWAREAVETVEQSEEISGPLSNENIASWISTEQKYSRAWTNARSNACRFSLSRD